MQYTQEQFTKMRTTLERIAEMPLWGEYVPDDAARIDSRDVGEYNDSDGFTPSADTESTMIREAVEAAREALGLPLDVPMPESEA